MMTTISAFMVKTTPEEAVKVWYIEMTTPPQAASAPPSAKAKRAARSASMPTSGAEAGATATARSAVPQRVWVSAR